MGKLQGLVALVTGASRGIGRAIALEFANEGASVVANYVHQREQAEEVVHEIGERGAEALAIQADVTVEAEVRKMVRAVLRKFGRIDILVPNAGVTRDQLVATMQLDEWETVIQTNLRGPFLCIREVVPQMMSQKSGCIVNISSIAADRAGRGHANYVAAKGGINAMTRSLAIELAHKGIRVNAVSPGVILTDMSERVRSMAGDDILKQIPLGRFGDPYDVARAVTFLASAEADYITGEILYVTGGFGL
jgi:3-oxoacyl-[acyl-carrier protein] reductase